MATTDIDRQVADSLSRVLRSHRDRLGLTQEAAAARAGIDAKYLQSMESGKGNSSGRLANPSLQKLRLIATAYGVTVPDLMTEIFGSIDVELD